MGKSIPVAETTRTSYENFVVQCPCCKRECIFNRVSDLSTTESIAGLDTRCLNKECLQQIRIVGDSVNERHEMLIFDCCELLEHKQYMYCVLNLVQAYEMFFSLFLRVELLYKPFAVEWGQLDRLNELSEKLSKKIDKFTFHHMRKLFLWRVTAPDSPKNLDDSNEIIEDISNHFGHAEGFRIDALSDEVLRSLLRDLERVDIHKTRNKVVHKQGYRPTRDEVENALKETRRILHPLSFRLGELLGGSSLGLCDDPNWYVHLETRR